MGQRIQGWEIVDRDNRKEAEKILWHKPDRRELRAGIVIICIYLIVFTLSLRLSGIGLSFLPIVQSIKWSVVILAILFEFLDSSAGMGYGTAMTPLLLVLGYHPLEIVPAIMIQQAVAGFSAAYLHGEFGNIKWQMKPMSETLRVVVLLTITGSLAVVFSITSAYTVFKVAQNWIKLYTSLLLLVMGVVSILEARTINEYLPRRMIVFGAIAGFNKGIGGGGYGPVVTIGGILSGIPVKAMMAITSLAEGFVCLVSIAVWLYLSRSGLDINFVLLPPMIIGSSVATLTAPYVVKVLPSRFWKVFVPTYCVLLAIYLLLKVGGVV